MLKHHIDESPTLKSILYSNGPRSFIRDEERKYYLYIINEFYDKSVTFKKPK